MINPELIAGMLFLPSMADNEAIEIVGAERFCDYKGWVSGSKSENPGLWVIGDIDTQYVAEPNFMYFFYVHDLTYAVVDFWL